VKVTKRKPKRSLVLVIKKSNKNTQLTNAQLTKIHKSNSYVKKVVIGRENLYYLGKKIQYNCIHWPIK
jgi:hypothetical protein